MIKLKHSLLLLSAAVMLTSCCAKVSPEEAFVNKIVDGMSIEEKVAQMRMFQARTEITLDENDNLVLSPRAAEAIKIGIGGLKNPGVLETPERAAKLTNLLQKYIIEHSPSGIPAFFAAEAYNGVEAEGCTGFSRPITVASSWNLDLVHQVYDCMGREARLRGIHITHSPEADVARDPRFGRMSETFGEDTYLVTEMIVSAINGLQGDVDGLGSTHIGAVAKHFAGYAQVAGGRNFASIEISPRTLIDEILPPFKAAVERCKTAGIMASHGDINGVACHSSEELLNDILRDEWGFDGYVVSDANDINRLNSFMHTAETAEAAVVAALKAGMDIDLYGGNNGYAMLTEMVKEDPELEEYMDKAVKRVLLTKVRLGLFDNPYVDESKTTTIRNDEALALASYSDQESIILLKNEEATLPLNPNKKRTIALVGPTVDTKTQAYFEKVAGDNIRFVVEKGFPLTNQQGIADGDGDGENLGGRSSEVLLTSKKRSDEGIARILKVARSADAVILFVGGDPFTSREAYFSNVLGDRADIELVGAQNELIAKIKALGKPMVGVLKHRRTLAATELFELSDAVLDCWELSEAGDQAIAKVIFGEVNPSGKLPVTIPRTIGQHPFHYSQKEINYKKGYLFLEDSPLYPFGYGLSYSSFEYSDLKLSSATLGENGQITLSVRVTNNSDIAGREVVQLYIKDIIGEVVRPNLELKGFQKISLDPHQTVVVEFTIEPEMLRYTGLSMERILDDGDYKAMVGGNSRDLLVADFVLEV